MGSKEQNLANLAKANAAKKERGIVRGKDKLATVIEGLKASYDELGGKEWLVQLAKRHPQTYAALLAKLIPSKIEGDMRMTFSSLAAEFHKPDLPDDVA